MRTQPHAGRPAAPPSRDDGRSDCDSITAIGVVIPAHNEQAHLGRCLDAVRAAAAHLRASALAAIEVRIVVVLDSCTDRSADIASFYRDVEIVATDRGQVGAARSLGARSVLPRSIDRARHIWLANTDADSTVPTHWLAHMIDGAQRGADLILGTVEPDNAATRRLRHAWRERHNAEDGHPHIHGANLGIRGSAYLQLGGWHPHASGEDATLVSAAEADHSVRTLRSGAIPVLTSSRLTGRAPLGFAHYLQTLTNEIKHPALTTAPAHP